MAPWVRPFIVLGLLFAIIKQVSQTPNRALTGTRRALLLVLTVLCFVSYIGLNNELFYTLISQFWHAGRIGDDETRRVVAVVAAAQGRISSIFGQPAAAGLAFFCITISLVLLRDRVSNSLLFLSLSATIFFGALPQSTFFSYGFLIALLLYPLFRISGARLGQIIFSIIFFSPSILFLAAIASNANAINLLGGEDLMAGRFNEDSHALAPLLNLSWSDYIFGGKGLSAEGIRIGDSAITMRIVLGGLIFHFFYQSGILYLIIKLIRLVSGRKDRAIILSALTAVSYGELGFTSFSQAQSITFLVFLPLLIGALQSLKFHTNKVVQKEISTLPYFVPNKKQHNC
jgi:hypothetical protein